MQKLTLNQYRKEFGMDDWIAHELDVEYVYISELENCPYIGVEYSNGEVWVYGLRVDHKVEDGDELEYYLSQE